MEVQGDEKNQQRRRMAREGVAYTWVFGVPLRLLVDDLEDAEKMQQQMTTVNSQ